MIDYLVLSLALFVVVSAVILGFLLFPWFFLLLFLLVPIAAVRLRNNDSGAQDEPVSTSIAISWAILGLLGLTVVLIGLPAIVLGIWLHPYFFLILLLLCLLLALPLRLSLNDPAKDSLVE